MPSKAQTEADASNPGGRQHSNGEGFPHLNRNNGACMCTSGCCYGPAGCRCRSGCSGKGHTNCRRATLNIDGTEIVS